ncbi:DUF2268 domain-containing putative Zn-dependent protease [Bacillus sp. FJAT-22090]|uniref:DUF2268 domain-containing putative Zn-dependent protease n=1 Tax=Bacillus sp. FJAT-22090 TaxID=1581038 RepID=UPI00119D2670|nr:DUF2268 domain-containing putative Zn-dependent protease [Bacillus sp. FJAT-22090]
MNIANKALVSFCMLLVIFILSACKQTEPSHENKIMENEQQNITYSFKNPNTGQEFNIIHAYTLYENYFETVKDNPDESPYQLYKQVVIEPVYDACFKDAEYDRFSVYEWAPEESDFNSIKNQIESLDKEHMTKLIEESLVKSSDILSSDKKTTVCVFPDIERFPSDMMTLGTGKMTVLLSDLNNYFELSELDNFTKAGISHEYHHSVWTEMHYSKDYFFTVLDNIIMEGSAIMFETLMYPDTNSTEYVLDESFNKEYWRQIETYLESSGTNEFILGGSKGLPDYYGYSEGYKMIRSYLNLHPDATVEEWTSKSPREIFEEGDYMSNYE